MIRQESEKSESKWCHKACANTPCSRMPCWCLSENCKKKHPLRESEKQGDNLKTKTMNHQYLFWHPDLWVPRIYISLYLSSVWSVFAPTHPPTPKTENANNSTCLSFFVVHPPPQKKNIPSQTTTNDNQQHTRDSHNSWLAQQNLHTWHSSRVPLDESTQNALRQGASWRVKNKDLQFDAPTKTPGQGSKKDAERMYVRCNWSGCVPPLDGSLVRI